MDAVSTLAPPELNALSAAAEADRDPVSAELCGVTFTLRSPVPMGALAVFATRLSDKNLMVSASSMVRFMRAWIVPELHEAIDDMMDQVVDIESFSENELPKLVVAATGRPT